MYTMKWDSVMSTLFGGHIFSEHVFQSFVRGISFWSSSGKTNSIHRAKTMCLRKRWLELVTWNSATLSQKFPLNCLMTFWKHCNTQAVQAANLCYNTWLLFSSFVNIKQYCVIFEWNGSLSTVYMLEWHWQSVATHFDALLSTSHWHIPCVNFIHNQ